MNFPFIAWLFLELGPPAYKLMTDSLLYVVIPKAQRVYILHSTFESSELKHYLKKYAQYLNIF